MSILQRLEGAAEGRTLPYSSHVQLEQDDLRVLLELVRAETVEEWWAARARLLGGAR